MATVVLSFRRNFFAKLGVVGKIRQKRPNGRYAVHSLKVLACFNLKTQIKERMSEIVRCFITIIFVDMSLSFI